jgi:peptidoglycan/xylan/chitin deacetylase (PgdA/CDA1 family)
MYDRSRWLLRHYTLAALAAVRGPATKRGLRFVVYHHVGRGDRDALRRHLKFLAGNGRVVAIHDAIQLLEARAPLPEAYYCINFDDGLASVYENAWPILEEAKVPAAVFVVSGLISGENFLSWDQCRAMSASPLITIGSHSAHHYRFSTLSDRAAALELSDSKAEIEDRTGNPCEHFCCPFGRRGDFNADRDPKLAQEIGYSTFLTSIRGANRPGDSLYRLRRDNIRSFVGVAELRFFLA